MLGELLSILTPIYLCVGLGTLWARMGRRYDAQLVTELITDVGAPCLVFSSLTSLEVDPGILLRMSAATLVALATFGVLGALGLRLLGLSLRSFLPPLMFPNTGNMGLPVCLFAFGEPGLALATCFFATTAVIHLSVGQWIWTGGGSPAALLKSPLALSAAAGGLAIAFQWTPPEWLLSTTRLVGSFTIPLMQFTLGVSLARVVVGRLSLSLGLAVARLAMGAGVGWVLAPWLGLEGVARQVFVLDCAMPVAVFNYMLAERYERHPVDVAGSVVASTLLAFATLPLLLALLRV